MELSTSKKVGRMILTGACAAALALGTAIPAFAAPDANHTAPTDVTYNPNTIVPGAGNWGVEIPRAIAFSTDINQTSAATIRLINTDEPTASVVAGSGPALSHFPGAGVKIGMWSQGGLQMTTDSQVPGKDNDPVAYTLSFAGAGNTSPVAFHSKLDSSSTGTDVIPSANTSTGGYVVGTLTTKSVTDSAATITARRTTVAQKPVPHKDLLTFGYKADGTTPVTPAL